MELDGLSYLRSLQHRIPHPGKIPVIPDIEMYGGCLPKVGEGNDWMTMQLGNEPAEKIHIYGGDHITWIDFEDRFGITKGKYVGRGAFLITDVSGHGKYEPILTASAHHAALVGVKLALRYNGDVTPELFTILNDRFYATRINSGRPEEDTIAALYAEIWSEPRENDTRKTTIKFISAGNPTPLVFSTEDNKIREVEKKRKQTTLALGYAPSKGYHLGEGEEKPLIIMPDFKVNEMEFLGPDIFIFGTDGFFDHSRENSRGGERETYVEGKLEKKLKELKRLSAKEIWEEVKTDILSFASLKDEQNDDITYIIVKRA